MSEFDDKPITSPEEDSFEFDPLAKSIADSISKMEMPNGTVIAVNGPWGSGKSSLINLVRWHLRGKENRLSTVDFRCWWFRGEEALTLAFFQELYSAMNPSLTRRTKKVLSKLGQYISVAGVTLNAAGVIGADKIASSFGKFIAQDETVEKLHGELSKALKDGSKRYLIVIDDIDRLSPDEAILIFRLVKSVGELPNVMYLLAYDRPLAEKIVTERYPSEGPHYLEKIVQASFELPEPSRSSLNSEFLRRLESIIEGEELRDEVDFHNLFDGIIAPEIKTPRDLLRILNPLKVTWAAIKGEVDIADFLCLETLRIQRPGLYRTLRSNKSRLTGKEEDISPLAEKPSRKQYDEIFLEQEPLLERERLRRGLIRLFPTLRRVWLDLTYTDNSLDIWNRQRRVCSPRHFDTYFRFALPNDVLSRSEIAEFIARSAEPEFVQRSFLDATKISSPNFGTKATLLLEELIIHAPSVSDAQVGTLLKAIYSIADRLDVEKDREDSMLSGNMLTLYLLTRELTLERFDLKTRSPILVKACKEATLGWLVEFTIHAFHDHFPPENTNPEPDESCLTTRNDAVKLRDYVVERIREADQDGSLRDCSSLLKVLKCWVNFVDSDEEARSWASNVIRKDDIAVARLAKAFTRVSSTGVLGDTVARQSPTAITGYLESLVDLDEFRLRAEQVVGERKLPDEDHKALTTFLNAWRRQEESGRESTNILNRLTRDEGAKRDGSQPR